MIRASASWRRPQDFATILQEKSHFTSRWGPIQRTSFIHYTIEHSSTKCYEQKYEGDLWVCKKKLLAYFTGCVNRPFASFLLVAQLSVGIRLSLCSNDQINCTDFFWFHTLCTEISIDHLLFTEPFWLNYFGQYDSQKKSG